MARMRITITGVDQWFPAAELVKLARLEREIEVEFGVLLGSATGEAPRFPAQHVVEAFAGFAAATGLRSAIHLCGTASRAVLAGNTDHLVPLCRLFGRVQINGCGADLGPLVRFRDEVRVPVIAQVRDSFRGPRLQYLQDASGGRGIEDIDGWKRARPDTACGYAGGVSAANVQRAVAVCRKLGGRWIDLETHVRTGDRLDRTKVRHVLREAARAVGADGGTTRAGAVRRRWTRKRPTEGGRRPQEQRKRCE